MCVSLSPSLRDFEEFRRAVRKDVGMAKQQVTDAELREIFDQTDGDGGGTISLPEFAEVSVRERETQILLGPIKRRHALGHRFDRLCCVSCVIVSTVCIDVRRRAPGKCGGHGGTFSS